VLYPCGFQYIARCHYRARIGYTAFGAGQVRTLPLLAASASLRSILSTPWPRPRDRTQQSRSGRDRREGHPRDRPALRPSPSARRAPPPYREPLGVTLSAREFHSDPSWLLNLSQIAGPEDRLRSRNYPAAGEAQRGWRNHMNQAQIASLCGLSPAGSCVAARSKHDAHVCTP